MNNFNNDRPSTVRPASSSSAFERRTAKLPKRDELVNEQIPFKSIVVIDDEGTNLGEMNKYTAIDLAKSKGLDLMVVAAKATPAICKILDYGKFKYEKKRKDKESKKHQDVIELKEVNVRPQIQEHDLGWRADKAIEWLKLGCRIKFKVMVMGRQARLDDDYKKAPIVKFLELIKDYGKQDGEMKMINKDYEIFIIPTKK